MPGGAGDDGVDRVTQRPLPLPPLPPPQIATLHTREEYIPDVSRWWANGNIICNVDSPSFWGDSYLTQLKDMLVQTCATRVVPDCEFFINKRDFPHLKVRAGGGSKATNRGMADDAAARATNSPVMSVMSVCLCLPACL